MDHNIRCEWCCKDVLREPVRNLFLETEGGIWWDWLSCAPFFVWEFLHNTYGLCFVTKTKQLNPLFSDSRFWKMSQRLNSELLNADKWVVTLSKLYAYCVRECMFKLPSVLIMTGAVPTSWSLSTHSGMSQASPSWDATVSSEAASFPKDHWEMRS